MVKDAIQDQKPHEVRVPLNGNQAARNKARRLVEAAKAEGWVLKTAVIDDDGTGWKVLFMVTGKVGKR